MAGLNRYTQQLFGVNAGTDQIAQFGSLFAGSPTFTTNIETMMSLSNWLTGWLGAAIGGNSPAIEDMNAVCTVFAYQLAYIMEKGVPEWDSGTTYNTGDICMSAGVLYASLSNSNLNNAVTNATYWNVIAGNILTALGDIAYGGANGSLTRLAGQNTSSLAFLGQQGTGTASAAPAWNTVLPPTVQKFLSGSGTYTLPTSPRKPIYIKVQMVGGGGGGAGSTSNGTGNIGSSGGATTFGTSLASAGGGSGGGDPGVGTPGTGGGTTLATGPIQLFGISGSNGMWPNRFTSGSSSIYAASGAGGASFFQGSGSNSESAGLSAAANSGSGGGGAGVGGASVINPGCGGGAGGYQEFLIYSPSATYAYNVGAGGNGGSAGSGGYVGGNGASGIIIVTEYYQ